MIRFVPSSAAEPLSQALWGLSRPPQVRSENDTLYLFGWITALDGGRWLVSITLRGMIKGDAADKKLMGLASVAGNVSATVNHYSEA